MTLPDDPGRLTSHQAIFDRVWGWFVTEQHPRAYENERCMYIDSHGNRCAIGACVSVEDAQGLQWEWEGEGIQSLEWGVAQDLFPDANIEFLDEIQSAHDMSNGPYVEPKRLRKVAEAWSLTIPGEPSSS